MQILFDFANQKIAINGEGPELVELFTLVRDLAPKLPSITITTGAVVASEPGRSGVSSGTNSTGSGNGADQPAGKNQSHQTMRQFVRSLSLSSISEKIAAIAFYQANTLGRPTFAPKEMGDWFTQCGLEKPSQISVAVFDAKKRNGLIDNASHGSWKLASQGESLIMRKIEEAAEKDD